MDAASSVFVIDTRRMSFSSAILPSNLPTPSILAFPPSLVGAPRRVRPRGETPGEMSLVLATLLGGFRDTCPA